MAISWVIVLGALATPALGAVAMCRHACALFEGSVQVEDAPASEMRGRHYEFRAAILKWYLGPSRFAVLCASRIAYPTMHGLVMGLTLVVALSAIQTAHGTDAAHRRADFGYRCCVRDDGVHSLRLPQRLRRERRRRGLSGLRPRAATSPMSYGASSSRRRRHNRCRGES